MHYLNPQSRYALLQFLLWNISGDEILETKSLKYNNIQILASKVGPRTERVKML